MISNRIHDNRDIANKWSEGKIEGCNIVFAKILVLESEMNIDIDIDRKWDESAWSGRGSLQCNESGQRL